MSKKHLADISLPDLELAMREIRAFEAENYMLENMLENYQQSSPQVLDTSANQQTKKRGGKAAQETAKAAPASLSIQQKMNQVQLMLDQQKAQLHAARDRSDKLLNEMTTRMDAQDEQMSSIMVERLCLKQAFGANNDGSRKPITAEKFVQYLEDSLRRKDAEMDKLQTKQKGVRAAVAKCDRELRHKEEAGESLKKIDFEQLQIENNQLLESIDARNSEVLGLKATSGRAQWALNSTKDELAKTLQSTEWLVSSEAQKRQQMDKMHSELAEAEKVVDKEKAYKKMLYQRLETSNNVPAVLEYVQQSEELTTLRSRIKLLSTKITVGEGQLTQLKRSVRSQMQRQTHDLF